MTLLHTVPPTTRQDRQDYGGGRSSMECYWPDGLVYFEVSPLLVGFKLPPSQHPVHCTLMKVLSKNNPVFQGAARLILTQPIATSGIQSISPFLTYRPPFPSSYLPLLATPFCPYSCWSFSSHLFANLHPKNLYLESEVKILPGRRNDTCNILRQQIWPHHSIVENCTVLGRYQSRSASWRPSRFFEQ